MEGDLVVHKILSEKHAVSIILFLYVFGPRTRTEIYNAISSSPNMPKKLELLEKHGLIKTVESEYSNKKMTSLADLGNKFAASLIELEERSGGDINEYRMAKIKAMMPEWGRIV